MRIILFLCLFGIIFFACVCLFIGQRIVNKLDSMGNHFEGWFENLRADLASLEEQNSEEHSILETKIIMSCRSNEQTAQAYDDLTRDVIKLMFGQGEAAPDPAEKE